MPTGAAMHIYAVATSFKLSFPMIGVGAAAQDGLDEMCAMLRAFGLAPDDYLSPPIIGLIATHAA